MKEADSFIMAWGNHWYAEFEVFPGVQTWGLIEDRLQAKRFKSKKEVIDRFNSIHAFPKEYIHMVHDGIVRAERISEPEFKFEEHN